MVIWWDSLSIFQALLGQPRPKKLVLNISSETSRTLLKVNFPSKLVTRFKPSRLWLRKSRRWESTSKMYCLANLDTTLRSSTISRTSSTCFRISRLTVLWRISPLRPTIRCMLYMWAPSSALWSHCTISLITRSRPRRSRLRTQRKKKSSARRRRKSRGRRSRKLSRRLKKLTMVKLRSPLNDYI